MKINIFNIDSNTFEFTSQDITLSKGATKELNLQMADLVPLANALLLAAQGERNEGVQEVINSSNYSNELVTT